MSRRRSARTTRDVKRPPEGQPWIWLTLELMTSPAWRTRSINCTRLIDFLLIEHMRHGGNENGALLAPYTQLVPFGINRRFIAAAINEAIQRGLVEIRRGARKGVQFTDTSRFRLTFCPTAELIGDGKWPIWHAPTDEWKSYQDELGEPK